MGKNPRQRPLFETDGDDATPVAADAALTVDLPGEVESPARDLGDATDTAAEGVPGDAAPGGRSSLADKRVYVLDAHSLIFQVFHGMPEMTSPTGQAVHAVYGFARDILFLLEQKKPDYLFAAFDRSEPTFRHDLFPAYKGDRAEMPIDLAPQIALIQEMLRLLHIPVVDAPSYEADDCLATLARQIEQLGGECFLVTGDKDCRQLITDRVKVYNIRKDEVFDAERLREEWGIRPDQVVDFQALVGDSVDGVPGVPLIGPKIAGELLQTFDTLEGVFNNLDKVAGKKRQENLRANQELALLSRRLVRLETQVPLTVSLDAGRVAGFDTAGAIELFRSLGFRSLPERLAALQGKDAPATWNADYRTVATRAELDALVAELAQQRQVSLDTETTSIRPRDAQLVGISLAWKPGEGYYLPIRAPAGEPQLSEAEVLAALRPHLENPALGKVGQNLKYDLIVLRAAGVNVQGVTFDTMIASYLLEAGERNHNLDDLARRYLAHDNIKIEELIGTGKQQKRMDEVPVPQITQYAAEDADVALRLAPLLAGRLDEDQLTALLREVELPLVDVLVEMEFNGIRVDSARLAELSAEYGRRMAAIEAEIYDLAEQRFNIASPKQLAEVLFTRLGLPVIKKTKTGPSTDADVLEELAARHPLPRKIVEYRQYAKLLGTYVDALPQMISPVTGRVHTSFNQTVAATGRLSSNEPNLQNIPIRTAEGREIRSAFRPGRDGWKLLAADYSQIELRVLAHFSADRTLCEAFARDEDIHTRVASEVFGVPAEAVTSDQRRRAKAINFGVIYGQSAFGLAKSLHIAQDEAAAFIEAYFARYPGVDEFLSAILAECRRNGYVKTILGRRRAIQGVRDESSRRARDANSRQRTLPERTAINTVIQGSAADLIKQAMLATHRRLRAESLQARMLLQIHDELIFEAPPDEIEPLARLVRAEMAGAAQLRVPLKVDVKLGDTWADCEAV